MMIFVCLVLKVLDRIFIIIFKLIVGVFKILIKPIFQSLMVNKTFKPSEKLGLGSGEGIETRW